MTNPFHFLRSTDWRRLRRYLCVAPVVLALTGCEQRFGLPDPATEQGEDVLDLWLVSFYAALGLGVLVLLLIAFALLRYRRRGDELPKQHEGSVALEITYTIIPLIVVAALFGFALKAQNSATELTDNPAVRVDVTGYQWNWRFSYTDKQVTVIGDNVSEPELVLPVDQRTRFSLVSADVNHSFFVPGFLTKRDLIPGVRNDIEVTPKKLGTYVGHCAELCGLNHSQMNFTVRVVPQPEYDQWLIQQRGAPA